jgi:hypothetical protein
MASGTYDEAGNVLAAGAGALFEWDVLSTMTRYTNGTVDDSFVYTADAERIAVLHHGTGPAAATWSVRDLDGKVLRQFHPDPSQGLFSDGFEAGNGGCWSSTVGGSGGTVQGSCTELVPVRRYAHRQVPPVKAHVTRFDVHVGQCTVCGSRVQGRHRQQSSDALGAAASQLGPRAQALAAELHVRYGLSFGKVQDLFRHTFDLSVSRSGLYVAAARAARLLEPTCEAMHVWIRKAPIVSADEASCRGDSVSGLGELR